MKFATAVLSLAMAETDVRVIGGYTPPAHRENYILSLQRSRLRSHFCGASLVSANKAICAAHSKFINVKILRCNSYKSESSQQVQTVSDQKSHPQYNSSTFANDISVLTMLNSFTLNDYVRPIALPAARSSEWMTSGTSLRVCGWGNTSTTENVYPATLKCVEVPYVTNADCNAPESYDGGILSGMFCAGLSQGGKDACQGDSGGPVTKDFGTSVSDSILVGATSWGYGCAQPNYPGVYSDVAMFREDFIDQNM
ncbi:Oidioi.mRNA.OKI2018_I69.chr1.g2510.t1.cds [Oikopleura dioica]|uniref:Oidioi.mRNA.OKI2018_I69.chr1.g2510.t1.cds n=1 Tax=Oikopleura dioica TaxID=34765 RepID=A0ABN7SWJ0_OIKDI|nr:Oidioi.mRNA.OKI2018_I69.chr1.g2510.t1.cds [Oikopleura dioica]